MEENNNVKSYPEFLGLTWIGWLNMLLFQWIFIRLTYGKRLVNEKWIRCFGILVGAIPLSGWWWEYWGSLKYISFYK